ncbi:MAG: DNA helicase [Gallionellales bacterium GWA2_59_43]|nr:MAG: DNA helicase [Gallionellales bacterium GWA2_59_43]
MEQVKLSGEIKVADLLQRIEATLVSKLNLADFQNAVPMLREVSIVNDAEFEILNLELQLTSVPAFFRPKIWRIDSIGAGKRYALSDLDVQLDGALFSHLTEAEKAKATFVLKIGGDGGVELAREDKAVELLPRNQWGGLSHFPDLIAAFVQPNEPAVERLLKQTAEILRKNGKNPALDGYNGGSKHAWELVSGIWSAVAGMGLDYALPPASFEHAGQKVRGAAQIAESGLATCLDLALLFCSAIEQAGLNPILIFTKGHAFAGVWLKPEEFSATVVDDITALRKRVKLNELVLFETTVITQRPAPRFSFAVQLGAQHISEEKEEAFELAVDIRRARLHRIKPLASAEAPSPVTPPEILPVVEPPIEDAPDLPDEDIIAEPDSATLNPKDRLARWQRKLLDLSLRNNLLNFRSGKKSLKLEAPDPGALEDLLSAGTSVKLLSRPDLMDGSDPRDQAIYEGREREDIRREHALDALRRREVFVSAPQDELDTRLVDLYRTARNTLQEGGANTLFLAMGFLSWTRDDKVGQRYRAPLILVPVTLQRKSVRSGFTLVLHDDEPRFNPTLIEMLRQDFKLNLGVADGELPKDDAGLDVAAIWKSVSHAIKDIKGWEVTEDVVLAMFSFAKYLMWKDLTERTEQLRENAVVRHLIDTPRECFPSGIAFPAPSRLDQEFGPEQTFCPLPADSSQLSAVMAAARGKDFVLIGPPGTGKSQTISNLIAQCLAEGKRVLFVSEKIAALDVVYRRLREVGLGEFCLELHSSKARKLDVLAQLEKSWAARGDVDPDVWRNEAVRLKKLRDDLNVYVERLHFRYENGMTIFEAIGCVADGKEVPALDVTWNSANAHDTDAMNTMRDVVARLAVNAQAVGQDSLLSSPLAAVEQSEWSPSWQQALVEVARSVIPVCQAVGQTYEQFCGVIGLPDVEPDRRAREGIAVLAKILPNAAGRDWRFVLRPDVRVLAERLHAGADLLSQHQELSTALSPQWPDTVVGACKNGLHLLEQRQQTFAALGKPWAQDVVDTVKQGLVLLSELRDTTKQLSVQYGDLVEQLNVNLLQREWAKARRAIWPMSWWGKRVIRKQIEAAVVGDGEPDVGKDIQLLVKMRLLRSKISSLDTGTETADIWLGLKTKPEFAQCALRFQAVLDAARHEQPWEDVGFESIANRRCGEILANELANLRKLRGLDVGINALDSLGSTTFGLWAGLATQTERLEVALQFLAAVESVRESGVLAGEFPVVAQGGCGSVLEEDYKHLHRRAKLEQKLAEFDDLQEITAGLWNGLKTQRDEVELSLKFQTMLSAAIANLASVPEQINAIKESLKRLMGEGNLLLESGGSIADAGIAYMKAWGVLKPAIDHLVTVGHFSDASKADHGECTLDDLITRCAAIVRSESRLHTWCSWRKVRGQALALGLGSLVAGIENGAVAAETLHQAFETNYSRWWLNAVVDGESVIRIFVSAEHEKRIGDFRALDDRFTDLTRAWVRAGLCAELPTQESVNKNSEWGVLRREMSKKKRHMPLRELVSHIPSALAKLTPCLLMSPLSIAQYLAADATAFDVVVFDEASQIPVWDAIGAIARGKQVVMVGDPKQLPPTNFFDRAESDMDDEDVEGDLESILDECLGANLPTMNLAWHYRSRHESLIAFSNHRYYGGGLVTFPSPVTEDRAVSFHHVNGIYEKGGARINKPEAFALVADLVSRLKSPGFRESKLTIGVVTFNTEQQALIEDLLDEERRKDISLEPYFAEIELEPVFVKNLESVQGDERDIMYFSITYGSDIHGAVSMNFGPMNRDGGERRLNVAITRARHELRVFSSLKAEQMDLSRTQALGVRDLKHFLDFAERGPRALAEATGVSRGDFESPFEEAVAKALTRKGWQLHTQVGASDFRIDLAVVHPDAAGMYLTGIECDGATYHRSATARDRDKLREQVLRGLGWEILRVWSTDWWIDEEDTLRKLDARLRSLLDASRAKRAMEAEREAAKLAAAVIAKAGEESEEPFIGIEQDSVPVDQGEVYAKNVDEPLMASSSVFLESDPASVVSSVDPDAFFEDGYDFVLATMITHVIEVEGPVLDAVLARRIARAHGWQRTGSRIQERVDALAAKSHHVTREEVGIFYWGKERGPTLDVPFRRATGESVRTVDEICMPELIALGREILGRGKIGEAAIVVMARELGLQRLRAVSRGRVEAAMQQAAVNQGSFLT